LLRSTPHKIDDSAINWDQIAERTGCFTYAELISFVQDCLRYNLSEYLATADGSWEEIEKPDYCMRLAPHNVTQALANQRQLYFPDEETPMREFLAKLHDKGSIVISL